MTAQAGGFHEDEFDLLVLVEHCLYDVFDELGKLAAVDGNERFVKGFVMKSR